MSATDFGVLLDTLKSLDNELDTSVGILGRIFDTCLKLDDLLEDSNLSSNEKLFQDAVKMCIKSLEKCTHMVNELNLFSSNEAIEEVETSSIKYLLLPALLGYLNLNLQSKELSERYKILEIAEVYFRDFLLRCKNYELSKRKLINKHENEVLDDYESDKNVPRRQQADLEAVRQNKIQQYKLIKELREREIELKPALERPDADEYVREYYLLILERWMLKAFEELRNIKSEESILGNILENKDSLQPVVPEKSEIKPLKPIIITKNEIQKRVFGLGYPSIPVLTIDDFYRQRFEKMVNEHKNNSGKSLQEMAMTDRAEDKEKEEIEKEILLDKDDFEALQKARAWDEWKDDNPRGSGNRKNKG